MPDLQKGLIGHWTMNSADTDGSTIRDRSAYDNHGTLNGGITAGVSSPVGEGFEFDGTSGTYVQTTSKPTSLTTATIFAWVKTTQDAEHGIIANYAGGGGSHIGIRTESGGVFSVYADDGSTAAWQLEHPKVINDGDWHSVCLVFEANSTLSIYVDEEDPESQSISVGEINPSVEFQIGNDQAGSHSEFHGSISGVRVYNRALSQSEVNQLYNFRGNSRKSQTTVVAGDSLQAWYPFLQSGAADKSGNGNDGTVNGATYNGSGGPEGLGEYNCDGFSNSIEGPVPSSVQGSKTKSLSGWVNPNSLPNDGNFYHLINFGIDSADQAFGFFIRDTTVRAYHFSNDSNTGYSLSEGRWDHLVLTYDGSTSRTYINGNLEDSFNSGTLNTGSTRLAIGANESLIKESDCRFSDVRIYDKALSNSEINQLYDPKSVNLDRGLVGHWSMDDSDVSGGTLYDRSAYDSHGTLNNSPSLGQPGIVGDSIAFDQTNNIDVIGETYDKFSAAFWVNFDAFDASYNGPLDTVISSGHQFTFHDEGGNRAVQIITPNGSTNILTTNANTGVWYHLAATYDGSIVKGYKNGVLQGSHSESSIIDLTNGFGIGARYGNKSIVSIDGRISDVRMYNRVLSEKKINALYNKRTTTSTNSEGIIAELYDTQTYYGNNSHPSNKTGLDEFFDTSNNGVSLEKKRVHNRPHIFWGSSSQGAGIGNVNPYPYYITTGDKDGYAWKIESSFVAPETGTYTFGIDSDDASDVLINGNVATSYYGAHGFSGDVSNHTGTISLTKDVQYNFAARFQEGGGGDGIAVAWQKPSDSSLSKFPLDILSPIQK